MGIVTAGTQMHAEAGLIHHKPRHESHYHNHQFKRIQIGKYRSQYRNLRDSRDGNSGRNSQYELIGRSTKYHSVEQLR